MRTAGTTDHELSRVATDAAIPGRATAPGTSKYAARFASSFAPDFFRQASGLTVSSIGMGTYLGECDDEEDARYTRLIVAGIAAGLNVLDTAINYRCQRSERAVGRAIRQAISSGSARREEIFVCTKGGYVPLDGAPPVTRDGYEEYLRTNYFERGTITRADLVAGGHCLLPSFLADQIERSRANLGVECIDLFYLHNPEQQLDAIERPRFLERMRDAFAQLESHVAAGHIAAYGCATWNGFRVFAANRNHLLLPELISAAVEAGGAGHHFRAVQLPVNLAMTEAARAPTQGVNGRNVALLDLAKEMKIAVIASASLMQSQLTRDLPAAVRVLFPALQTDAQRALAFTRSLPLASALVGMRSMEHLWENLAAGSAVIEA